MAQIWRVSGDEREERFMNSHLIEEMAIMTI